MDEFKILLALNKYYIDIISDNVITNLYKLSNKNFPLSGEDSGLKSVWEEICVQVQVDRSIHWDTYKDTIVNYISDEFRQQPVPIMKLLVYVANPKREYITGVDDEVIEDIIEQLLIKASNYSNRNIEKYIKGDDENEEL